MCSYLDIIRSTLSSLVVGGEAPAVSLTLLGDDQTVISGSRDELAIDARKDSRLKKKARLFILIEEHVILVQLGDVHTALGIVDPTPNKNLTGFGDRECVVTATDNLLDVEILEAIDDRGGLYRIILIILILGNTSLAESVKAPRIDLS